MYNPFPLRLDYLYVEMVTSGHARLWPVILTSTSANFLNPGSSVGGGGDKTKYGTFRNWHEVFWSWKLAAERTRSRSKCFVTYKCLFVISQSCTCFHLMTKDAQFPTKTTYWEDLSKLIKHIAQNNNCLTKKREYFQLRRLFLTDIYSKNNRILFSRSFINNNYLTPQTTSAHSPPLFKLLS